MNDERDFYDMTTWQHLVAFYIVLPVISMIAMQILNFFIPTEGFSFFAVILYAGKGLLSLAGALAIFDRVFMIVVRFLEVVPALFKLTWTVAKSIFYILKNVTKE